MLEDVKSGLKMNQTTAICRYLGALYELYGKSDMDKYWADWAIETRQDFWKSENVGPFMKPDVTDEDVRKSTSGFENLVA